MAADADFSMQDLAGRRGAGSCRQPVGDLAKWSRVHHNGIRA